jgi:hypothetical protein
LNKMADCGVYLLRRVGGTGTVVPSQHGFAPRDARRAWRWVNRPFRCRSRLVVGSSGFPG